MFPTPGFGQCSPKLGNIGRLSAKVGQRWSRPTQPPNLDEFCPRARPVWHELDQIQPESLRSGRPSKTGLELASMRSKLVEFGPSGSKLTPKFAGVSAPAATFERVWGNHESRRVRQGSLIGRMGEQPSGSNPSKCGRFRVGTAPTLADSGPSSAKQPPRVPLRKTSESPVLGGPALRWDLGASGGRPRVRRQEGVDRNLRNGPNNSTRNGVNIGAVSKFREEDDAAGPEPVRPERPCRGKLPDGPRS